MSRRVRTIIGAVIVLLIGGRVLWATAGRMYFEPRAALTAQITDLEGDIDRYERALDQADAVDAGLTSFVARTLGGDAEVVDHRLRTRLNRLAEAVGLTAPAIGTGRPSAKPSPARRLFRGRAMRELRDEIDFRELEAWVSGEGDFEQVIALIDRIDAEPWLKHIHQVRVEPRSGTDRFDVTVRLTTLFLPGREPEAAADVPYASARLVAWSDLIASNPFALPAPPPAPAPAAPPVVKPQPPPPPAFPWHEWMITGLAEGPGGPEIWIRNTRTKATQVLAVGARFDEAEVVAIESAAAVFKINESMFRVEVGERFSRRTPVSE